MLHSTDWHNLKHVDLPNRIHQEIAKQNHITHKTSVFHVKTKVLPMIMICSMLLCFIVCHASASTVSTNLQDLYDNFYSLFIIGEKHNNFGDTLEYYENNPVLENYQDASKIYRYVKGRISLDNNDLAEAKIYFLALADFRDSQIYLSYIYGREAEANLLYDEAISYYAKASELSQLDCLERMKECNKKISEEKKELQYQSTVDDYNKAITSGNTAEVARVRDLFSALGDYKDSASYKAECESWLQVVQRKIVISVENNGTSLDISWDDTESNCAYNLYCHPQYGGKMIMLKACVSPVTLSQLIPGTSYDIVLCDASNENAYAEISIKTKDAPQYRGSELQFIRLEFAGIQRNDILRTIPPAEIFNDYSDFSYESPEGKYTAAFFSSYISYNKLTVKNLTGEPYSASFHVVLRSDQSGVWVQEAQTFSMPEDNMAKLICLDLDKLFQDVLDEKKIIPIDHYTLEVYLDDSLMSTTQFFVE